MDINFDNVFVTNQGITIDYSVSIEENPPVAQGNRLLANIFEITFMTSVNDSLLSNGYGGDGVGVVGTGFDPNDTQSIATMVKVAADNTVLMMKADQANTPNLPSTEKISSASVDSISKVRDNVTVKIRIVPEEYEPQYATDGLVLTLPL